MLQQNDIQWPSAAQDTAERQIQWLNAAQDAAQDCSVGELTSVSLPIKSLSMYTGIPLAVIWMWLNSCMLLGKGISGKG